MRAAGLGRVLGAWHIGEVHIQLSVGQQEPHPPVVRIIIITNAGRTVRDGTPELANELADILGKLHRQDLEGLTEALRQAALLAAKHDVTPHPGEG
ncbi:hypothetical protein [Streptomyces albidoflavus]|uniref:hypothetical protein n=1 Tax=Streptomyces albidoflavus TaxID=1886 RepID=UPI003324724E